MPDIVGFIHNNSFESDTVPTPSESYNYYMFSKEDGIYLINPSGTITGPLIYNGSQIDHTTLSNIGTNTHAQIDSHIGYTTTAHGGIREKLSASRTYYVRTDGNDSNDGLTDSSGGAFLTIQKAVDTVATLDINGQTVTIQLGDTGGSPYTAVSLKNVTGFSAPGNLVIQGNSSTPANVEISASGGACVLAENITTIWDVKDLKVTNSAGYGLRASNATMRFSGIDFGACSGGFGYQMSSEYGGFIVAIGNYTVSGNAARHWNATNNGRIATNGRLINYTAGVAYTYNAYANLLGLLAINGMTFSGSYSSVTGARYYSNANSVIFTNAGGASYLPGSTSGTTANGGLYL